MAEQGKNVQEQEQEKKYSDAEVDAMFDKKFAKLAEKHKAEMDKAIADAVAQAEEAHKLAQMNEKERQAHEYEAMEKKLQALEAEKQHNSMMTEARAMLKADNISGISDDILTVLVTEDAETTKNAVKAFSAAFQTAVNEAVKAQLADTEPRRGSTASGMTKEEILAIKNPTERQKAIEDNLSLFKGMLNGGK